MTLPSLCLRCRRSILSPLFSTRPFNHSARILADDNTSPVKDSQPRLTESTPLSEASLLKSLRQTTSPSSRPPTALPGFSVRNSSEPLTLSVNAPRVYAHHFHVYATKHNTHLTLTSPTSNPLISISAGNIGFRKANRGTYDAAYQLGAYMMGRIQQQGLMTEIQELELILRGFGPGREAITKIFLGSEGRSLRGRVVKVMDATRLKFGGTRGKKPRRLG